LGRYREYNIEIHILLVDHVKVFDSFAQEIMGNNGRKGFPIDLIRTVQSIVMSMECDYRGV
jgi:hypothetical protein